MQLNKVVGCNGDRYVGKHSTSMSDLGRCFGMVVRTVRRRLGYNDEELAAAAGINVICLLQIEDAKSEPALVSAVRLAKAMRVPLETLVALAQRLEDDPRLRETDQRIFDAVESLEIVKKMIAECWSDEDKEDADEGLSDNTADCPAASGSFRAD